MTRFFVKYSHLALEGGSLVELYNRVVKRFGEAGSFTQDRHHTRFLYQTIIVRQTDGVGGRVFHGRHRDSQSHRAILVVLSSAKKLDLFCNTLLTWLYYCCILPFQNVSTGKAFRGKLNYQMNSGFY